MERLGMKGWETQLPTSFPLERVRGAAIREARRRRGRRRRLYQGMVTAVCALVLVGAGVVAAGRDQPGDRIQAGPEPSGPIEVGQPLVNQVNGKIAFIRRTGPEDRVPKIYVMNEDGSGQTMIAETTQASHLAWSPDGTMLAFDDVGGIYVVSADGTGERRLSTGPGRDQTPAWSPDGTRIAVRSLENMTGGIAVINVEGGGRRQLTNNMMDGWPAWSPDGRMIAFSRDTDIYVMNADGSGQRRFTDLEGFEDAPTWSPDGRRIAFRHNSTISVADVDGGRARQLASPGGTGMVDPSGRGANKLAVGRGDPSSPRWSPDGTKLVYALWQTGASCSIWVMSADGGEQRPLTDNQTCDHDPAWQPRPG
ncbi:MAG TPA: hypothetical protein VHF27_11260 [Acidimicrobiales bacterium]|nr:hypothetical protein [Acidimicrobiales bacterium]